MQVIFHYHLHSVLQLHSCLSKSISPLWTFPFIQDKIPTCLDIHPGILRHQVKFTEQWLLSSQNVMAIPTSPSTQPGHAGSSFPASPLHFQEAGFSHRPSVRTLTMQSEIRAASSPPLSMTVAQGLQIQPELGHFPVRDHLPSLLLFLQWPKWSFHLVLSQPSLVLESVLPFTFLSPRSGIPASPL